MWQELHPYWEMFLKKAVHTLLRGDRLPTYLVEKLPVSWIKALASDISIRDAITEIWNVPPPHATTNFSNLLADRVNDLCLVISESSSEPIGLAYIFRHHPSGDWGSWLGGLPISPADLLQTQAQLDLWLPSSYRNLLSIHNGLTRDGWSSLGPRPLNKLYYIEGSLDQQSRLSSRRLVAFSGDGAGNEQCYDLNTPLGGDDFWTVDWDHEVQQIGNPLSFGDYVYLLGIREMGNKTRSTD